MPVYVADTDEKAREEPRESVMHLLRYIGERLAASASASGARAIENRAERGATMQSIIDYEEVLRERMIVGTPERVIDRLEVVVRRRSASTASWPSSIPASLIPHAQVLEALVLLGQEVNAALQVRDDGVPPLLRFAILALVELIGKRAHK